MKTYKIEMVQISRKYAKVTLMAEDRVSAIEKAKNIEWEAFHEKETLEQTSWEAKSNWKLLDFLTSLLTRKDYK